jgi:hypothetical protein
MECTAQQCVSKTHKGRRSGKRKYRWKGCREEKRTIRKSARTGSAPLKRSARGERAHKNLRGCDYKCGVGVPTVYNAR